jgi:ElaA protein
MSASGDIQWVVRPFAELSVREFHDAVVLRERVFVVEQNCVYQDVDGKDPKATHVLGFQDGRCVAAARFFAGGVRFNEPSIGRVVSAPDLRRTGIGRELMRRAIDACELRYPGQGIRISAQSYLVPFYESFGFRVVADVEEYLEDGIPHREMSRG